MKKNLSIIVMVLAFAGVASANGITNGDWEDPLAWWDGVIPAASSTELVYVGPGGTTGTNYVTVSSDLPHISNQLYFSDVNVDINGTLNVENVWNWMGAYGPSVINVHSNSYFRVGPDVFALDGRLYISTINVTGNGFMETYWPHFYDGPSQISVNITDDATWKTWGLFFQDTGTIYPTAGKLYNINISGGGTFMIGNLTGHASGWSEADALAAISSGFITGTGLTVSTSADTFFTVVSAPGTAAKSPFPSDGAIDVEVDSVLSWSPGSNVAAPATYDVYFDTNPSPTTLVSNDQSGTTFDPFGASDMANGTTYYWRIDTTDPNGTYTGDVWSFTTVEPLPAPATLAWYKFNGNANDEINILNNGVVGPVSPTYGTGIDGQAVGFSGGADPADEYYTVSNWIGEDLRQSSVSFWVYPSEKSDPPSVILGTDDLPSGSLLLLQQRDEDPVENPGQISIGFSILGNTPQEVWVVVDPNEWSHVALSYDTLTDKCRTYLNGELDGEYDYTTAQKLDIGQMTIGAWYSSGVGYTDALKGSVDDLRIFNYPLSDLHVASLYTNFEPSVDICIEETAPALDLTGDCIVGLPDFALFAQSWLDCTSVPDCDFELP